MDIGWAVLLYLRVLEKELVTCILVTAVYNSDYLNTVTSNHHRLYTNDNYHALIIYQLPSAIYLKPQVTTIVSSVLLEYTTHHVLDIDMAGSL